MDTREKIVDAPAAAAAAREWRARGGRVVAACGAFDVLLAGHAGELAGAKGSADDILLFAVLAQPAGPVLSARARAELAAGLAVVDYVVTTDNGPALEAMLAALEPDAVLRLEQDDELRLRRLIEHVYRRHTGG